MLATLTTKKSTPLSTRSLAAFLTWKQFDLLLLVDQLGAASTRNLSEELGDILDYDKKHGGGFYKSVSTSATYSSMRTLENRQLVSRHIARNGLTEWTIKQRGRDALSWLQI